MSDFEKLKAAFLADDVDEDTKAENLAQIQQWETELFNNEALQGWRDHDITKQIAQKARDTFKEVFMTLGARRDLTAEQRASFHAKQDAAKWLLSMCEPDAKGAIAEVEKQIRTALNTI